MSALIRLQRREAADLVLPGPSARPPGGEAEIVLRGEMLAEARKMTDGIAAVLTLLRNVDGLMAKESDSTRLDEIAALFSDISDFAAYGALAVRRAAEVARPAQEPRGR